MRWLFEQQKKRRIASKINKKYWRILILPTSQIAEEWDKICPKKIQNFIYGHLSQSIKLLAKQQQKKTFNLPIQTHASKKKRKKNAEVKVEFFFHRCSCFIAVVSASS